MARRKSTSSVREELVEQLLGVRVPPHRRQQARAVSVLLHDLLALLAQHPDPIAIHRAVVVREHAACVAWQLGLLDAAPDEDAYDQVEGEGLALRMPPWSDDEAGDEAGRHRE